MISKVCLLALGCFLTAILMVGVSPAVAQDGEAAAADGKTVSVTVTGMGEDKDEAIKDAKRKAIEKGAGAFIYSQSKVDNFTLTKDTIITRTAGLLEAYKVKKAVETDEGLWEVTITAEVSTNQIQDLWGVVQNILQERGRPKIMVVISEKIDSEVVENSTLQTKIESELLKSGFLLVNKEQLKEIDKKDLAAAVAEDKPDKVQAIAKRFGAQIFITGTANAARGDDTEIGGIVLRTYEAEANVRAYRSDTAQIMSSVAGEPQRGAQRVARSAAKQALDSEAKLVSDKVTEEMLRFWQDVLEGRGEIQLQISDITFKQYTKLKKALKAVKGIKEPKAEFHNGNVEASFLSDATAEKIAERIAEDIEGLEIEDVTQNVIKASFKSE